MTNEEIDIAWFTGLLHDIGRFEQVRSMEHLMILSQLIMLGLG